MTRYKIAGPGAVLIMISLFLSSCVCTYAEAAENGHIVLAQGGYEKVYPVDVSPLPDIIQDLEWRERVDKMSTGASKASESKEQELVPGMTREPLLGTEPTVMQYQISVNDELYISVWRVPDLSMDIIVGPDGRISFPLVGDVGTVWTAKLRP